MNEPATMPASTVPDPEFLLTPEDRPCIDNLVTEDDTPVDRLLTEKQMRLLVGSLYSSWSPPAGRPFVAMANVGLFVSDHLPAIVPDILLSLDVRLPDGWRGREQGSYFIWVYGKSPDLAMEIVSNRKGGEDSDKLLEYARLGVPYYLIYDPDNLLGGGELRCFRLVGRIYEPISAQWMPELGLGLTLWQGSFEDGAGRWLRWCDQQGQVVKTGMELAEQERRRAEDARQGIQAAEQRAERLAELLRQHGIDPQ